MKSSLYILIIPLIVDIFDTWSMYDSLIAQHCLEIPIYDSVQIGIKYNIFTLYIPFISNSYFQFSCQCKTIVFYFVFVCRCLDSLLYQALLRPFISKKYKILYVFFVEKTIPLYLTKKSCEVF